METSITNVRCVGEKIKAFALLIIHNGLDTTRVCYATECISIDYISANVSLVIILHRRVSYYNAAATCKWTWMRRIPTCVCGISIVSLTRIILYFSEEAKTFATRVYYGNTFKLSSLVLLCFYCNHGNMYHLFVLLSVQQTQACPRAKHNWEPHLHRATHPHHYDLHLQAGGEQCWWLWRSSSCRPPQTCRTTAVSIVALYMVGYEVYFLLGVVELSWQRLVSLIGRHWFMNTNT